MQRFPSRELVFLFFAGIVVAAIGRLDSPLRAATVVVANRTDQPVTLAARLSSGQSGQTTLPPGRLIALPVGEAVELTYESGKGERRVGLDLNSLYYFVSDGDEVALRPVVFSRSDGVPWMHVNVSGEVPPLAVVTVKVFADEENPAVRRVWEAAYKRQIDTVSRIFEQYCRVRFEVVASGTWESDNALGNDSGKLFEEFRREASPEPARLAIGFTSQLRLTHQNQIPVLYQAPLYTHLLVPDAQKVLPENEQIVLLAHQLGHYLGAVETREKSSVMGQFFIHDRARLLKEGVGFDPPNTLAMNLLGEEIRLRDVRSLADVPRSTRRYLYAIYIHVDPHHMSEAFRAASLVYDAPARQARYTGFWTDGSHASADAVEAWHDAAAQPKLAGKPFFEGGTTIRWLSDNTLAPAEPPESAVEFFGGDCLPGRVTGFGGADPDGPRQAAHLRVAPHVALDWPDAPARPDFPVLARWVRRIVWQRATEGYEPGTLIFRDGRRLTFRSLRFAPAAVRLLTAEGVREIAIDDLAELHFPRQDPWDVWFEQLGAIAPDAAARIMQVETAGGLRATSSWERFQARARGNTADPNTWFHLVQPAWSLRPIWLAHRDVRSRCFFVPHEAPLSRIDAAAHRQQSDLGGAWPFRVDRNVEGGPLACGGREFAWGFGVHATSELEFPLPAPARAFRTRLGLDHLIGDGGCVLASVHLGSAAVKPLYASPLVIGSTDVLDSGRLELAVKPDAPGRLVLRVDAAHKQRPKGADPLDVRDHFDWLEPLVELDPEKLRAEIARRAPALVHAWQDWTLRHDALRGPLLVNHWDEERPQQERAYGLLVRARGVPLRLSRQLFVTAGKDRLLVAVSRPERSTPSRIEVRVDGVKAEEFEVPVRRSGPGAAARLVPLSDHHGKEVAVEIVQDSPDDRALVEWEAIGLVALPAEGAREGEKP